MTLAPRVALVPWSAIIAANGQLRAVGDVRWLAGRFASIFGLFSQVSG